MPRTEILVLSDDDGDWIVQIYPLPADTFVTLREWFDRYGDKTGETEFYIPDSGEIADADHAKTAVADMLRRTGRHLHPTSAWEDLADEWRTSLHLIRDEGIPCA